MCQKELDEPNTFIQNVVVIWSGLIKLFFNVLNSIGTSYDVLWISGSIQRQNLSVKDVKWHKIDK